MTKEKSLRNEINGELARIATMLEQRVALDRARDQNSSASELRGIAIDENEIDRALREIEIQLQRTAGIESISSIERPLERARRVFDLQSEEFDALIVALAVELDTRFARIVAYLNDHFSRTRPTVGLVLSLTCTDRNAVEFCARPAVREGLLQLEGEGPLSSLSVRVAREFLARLATTDIEDRCAPGVRLLSNDSVNLDSLFIGPLQRRQLTKWASQFAGPSRRAPLLVSGVPGAGRATAVHAAASAAGWRLVECGWTPERAERAERVAAALRDARWFDAALLVRVDEGPRDPDASGLWAALSSSGVPIALAVAPAHVDAVCAAAAIEPIVIELESPTIEQRELLWQTLLSPGRCEAPVRVSGVERRELAARYDFVPGALVRAVRRAAADRTSSDDAIDFESLGRACRGIGSAAMGALAQRLPQPYTRADLVLPADLVDELDLAIAWAANGRRVFEDWGFGRRVSFGRGLTALFTGEPGTGKTMTAQVLARELGLELFRVDLSRVMSKYIGEAEKNLSRLFDDAKASGSMLFFDEADALFGKRSEVKDAHDRYANIEIGYLLQRMEEHPGITVLATNRAGDLDKAFTRRFHFILDFPMPRPPERRRIWEGMLPLEAQRAAGIDLDSLAQEYEISGGEIRNSVLSAAFIAAQQGVPIGLRHLKRGLRRELLKSGRVLDARQRRELEE